MPNNREKPTFVLLKDKLQKNLDICQELTQYTNTQILYTLKGFDKVEGVSQIANSVSGFSIGNINELSQIECYIDKQIHTYAPAYHPKEVIPLSKASDTMSFNSITQWTQYHQISSPNTSIGLRINPKISLSQPSHCDSSHSQSRFGVSYSKFLLIYNSNRELFRDLDGLHFHIFCHQKLSSLKILLKHIATSYRDILPKLKWLNLGGGQEFTSTNYDKNGLYKLLNTFRLEYPHITIYFEPCSAIVANTGYFQTTILDIIEESPSIVILDTSIEAHLLDIAITNQQPKIKKSSNAPTPYAYRLTGVSCVETDNIGTYYFHSPLQIGDTIIFEDMIGYTMVKQTRFNGIGDVGFEVE